MIKTFYVMDLQNRPKGGITGHKEVFVKNHPPVDTLAEAVKAVKPTAIIGNSYIRSFA